MKKTGETLIESLVALLIISILILPMTFAINSLLRTNTKLNIVYSESILDKNILELLKSKSYNELSTYFGEHVIYHMNDFYNIFAISEKQQKITHNFILTNPKKIMIFPEHISFVDSNLGSKYLIKITVDNIFDYYLPNPEEEQ